MYSRYSMYSSYRYAVGTVCTVGIGMQFAQYVE